MQFATTALSVLSLCFLAVPGFILGKLKWIKAAQTGVLVTVLLYVNQPFILLNSFVNETYEPRLLANMGIVLAISLVSQTVLLGGARLLFCADKGNLPRARAYSYASSLGNVGFMGIPVVSALFPGNTEVLLYVSVFLIGFNLLCWTLGVYVLTGNRKYISLKKAFLNPPMFAILIALPIFFTNFRLPEALLRPIGFLADMNTPLAMIVLGVKFSELKWKEIVSGWGAYTASAFKLILCPLLVYAILLPIGISKDVKTVMLIVAAMPSANMVYMMTEKFEGDSVSAAKAVMISTLFSIVTIPIMLMLPI